MPRQLPSFGLFNSHYLEVCIKSDNVYAVAGIKQTYKNACAVRISYAFNKISGHKLPERPPGVHGKVLKGSDDLRSLSLFFKY